MKDNNDRATYITSYCNDMQTQAFNDGKQILNNATWMQNRNSNALKIALNPETHQMTGEKIENIPLELKLDASNYKNVP